MEYIVNATIRRTVTEEYECKIEEESFEDACDVVYEHFSTFPDSPFQLTSRRKTSEKTERVSKIETAPADAA